MSRIGATLNGIERKLLNRLADSQAAANLNALRLATGRKFNAAKDNPSAFIALSHFETEREVVTRTLSNVAAASSMVSKTQLALDQVRTQLNTIRTKALEDQEQALSPAQRTANQTAIDAAISEINRLAGSTIDGRRVLDGSANFDFLGRNGAQVSDLSVYQTDGGRQSLVEKQAEVIYTGADGFATAAANLTLTGNGGSVTFAVTTNSSLAQIAANVNAHTSTTGLVAEASGDQLAIRSTAYGDHAFVDVNVNSGAFVVTGADGSGRADGRDAEHGLLPSIAGTVDRAAERARLVYDAGGGTIAANATFTLTGDRGSVSIAVTTADTLADAATRINLESHVSGVTAAVDGNRILLESVNYGLKAEVEVDVTAGTFATTGGNGDGTSNGLNAIATINGVRYSGNQVAAPAKLVHTESSGTIAYNATFTIAGPDGTSTPIVVATGNTLSAVAGLINAQSGTTGIGASVDGTELILSSETTGYEAEIALNVTAGKFAIDGGNGDGTARGEEAVTNSGRVDGNRFFITDNRFRYEIEFAGGFTGELDTISVESGALQFALAPDVQRRSTLAVSSVHAARLGGLSGSLADLATGQTFGGLDANASRAIRIADEALGDLDRIEGLVDGFANATISSSAALMSAFSDQLDENIDSINKVDETEESLLMSKNEELINNAVASLAILSQQRSSILDLIQQAAGLRS
ncbi:MAG: flagellin hook IN motif-containing protein [Planctomycetia bacterium]|nr:flagellin hook IN motif-containing protein [Planctomycetia bacterium]